MWIMSSLLNKYTIHIFKALFILFLFFYIHYKKLYIWKFNLLSNVYNKHGNPDLNDEIDFLYDNFYFDILFTINEV